MYVCMYLRTYVCMYVCVYVRTCVRTYVCMYVCMSLNWLECAVEDWQHPGHSCQSLSAGGLHA